MRKIKRMDEEKTDAYSEAKTIASYSHSTRHSIDLPYNENDPLSVINIFANR